MRHNFISFVFFLLTQIIYVHAVDDPTAANETTKLIITSDATTATVDGGGDTEQTPKKNCQCLSMLTKRNFYFVQAAMHFTAAGMAFVEAKQENYEPRKALLGVSMAGSIISTGFSVYRGFVVPCCGPCADITACCGLSSLVWVVANVPLWLLQVIPDTGGIKELTTATTVVSGATLVPGVAAYWWPY